MMLMSLLLLSVADLLCYVGVLVVVVVLVLVAVLRPVLCAAAWRAILCQFFFNFLGVGQKIKSGQIIDVLAI